MVGQDAVVLGRDLADLGVAARTRTGFRAMSPRRACSSMPVNRSSSSVRSGVLCDVEADALGLGVDPQRHEPVDPEQQQVRDPERPDEADHRAEQLHRELIEAAQAGADSLEVAEQRHGDRPPHARSGMHRHRADDVVDFRRRRAPPRPRP